MVGSRRKEDVLFAVSALSNGLFDAYSETFGDYFMYSNTEAEMDTECGIHNLTL